MPLRQTTLRIFVASPSDCADERIALDEAVNELNKTWSSGGMRLDVIKWETHTHPAAGSSVQGVINTQIGDKYDIFVGIMWGRFGSPTAEDGSGTEE